MNSNAKRGTVSAFQFFSIIFISRAVVSFTYIQTISVGRFASDILIAYAISFFLSLLLSFPAVMCVRKGVSPFNNKFLSLFYASYYVFICALTVNRFSYFAVSKMNPRLSLAVIVTVILVAVCYGAYLGLEPLARFAGFCAVILGLVIQCAEFLSRDCEFKEPNYFKCAPFYGKYRSAHNLARTV